MPALPKSGSITKAQATAFANAVNLGVADVPGMVSVSQEGEAKTSRNEPKCAIVEDNAHIVDVRSPTFRRGEGLEYQSINSDVEVVSTTAIAEEKIAEFERDTTNARAVACLDRAYARGFSKGLTKDLGPGVGDALGRTTISQLMPTVPSAIGVRIALPFTITGPRGSVAGEVDVDAVGFVVGRALVGLTSTSGSRVASTLEDRLLSLLYARTTGKHLQVTLQPGAQTASTAPSGPSPRSPSTPGQGSPSTQGQGSPSTQGQTTPGQTPPGLRPPGQSFIASQSEWLARGEVLTSAGDREFSPGDVLQRLWIFQTQCGRGRCGMYWTRPIGLGVFTTQMHIGAGNKFSAAFRNEAGPCAGSPGGSGNAIGLVTSAFTGVLELRGDRMTANEHTYGTTPACEAINRTIRWTATRVTSPPHARPPSVSSS